MGCDLDKGTLEKKDLVSSIFGLVICTVQPFETRVDQKTVSIIVLGCFHPAIKVQSASIHFFLGDDGEKHDSVDVGDGVCLLPTSTYSMLSCSAGIRYQDLTSSPGDQ